MRRSAAGVPVAGAAQAQTDEVVYFYTDAVGSVRMTTDGAGTVLAWHDFHPFGGDAVPPTSRPE